MIVWYFCRRFLTAFFIVLGVLTAVLSAVNVVGKNVFSSPELLIVLFVGALPFMAVFVYPFALLCANLMVLYTAQQKNEFILINFFTQLRQQLLRSTLLNAALTTLFFAPLVLYVAPRSYDWGKQLLYSVLEQKIATLSPGLLHFPLPGIALYFEESVQTQMGTELRNFFLVQHRSSNPRPFDKLKASGLGLPGKANGAKPQLESVLWGERVILLDKKISMHTGSLVGFDAQTGELVCVAAFDEGLLDLEKLFPTKAHSEVGAKYQTIDMLWRRADSEVIVERYKRYVQMIWIALTPPCAYLLMLSGIVLTIPLIVVVAGIWFFLLYGLLLCLPLIFCCCGMWGLYLLVIMLMLVGLGLCAAPRRQ